MMPLLCLTAAYETLSIGEHKMKTYLLVEYQGFQITFSSLGEK